MSAQGGAVGATAPGFEWAGGELAPIIDQQPAIDSALCACWNVLSDVQNFVSSDWGAEPWPVWRDGRRGREALPPPQAVYDGSRIRLWYGDDEGVDVALMLPSIPLDDVRRPGSGPLSR